MLNPILKRRKKHLNILGCFSGLIQKKLENYLPPKASELGEAPLGGSGIKDTEDGRANRPNLQIYTF